MTTATPTAKSRDAIIWETLLERLANTDDQEGQLAALRVFAELDDEDLPIPQILDMLLATRDEHNGTLVLYDSDDLWTEGLDALERAPERMPLDPIVDAFILGWSEDTDYAMIGDLLERLQEQIDPQPFVDLLVETDLDVVQAGIEAMYYLHRVEPLMPFLTHEDEDIRAQAIENVWYLDGMDLAQLTAYTDVSQPEAVRVKAQYLLAQHQAQQKRLGLAD